MCLVISGCASFDPALRYSDLTKPREPTVKQTQERLEVSIEEFASKDKSEQAFGADIARRGVLALLLRLENGGTETYRVREAGVGTYIGAESLPSMTGESASKQGADSGYVGKALAWSLLSGPFTILPIIVGSVAHTAAVNRRIEEHFESLRFTDNLLKPNQIATGFFYFKLPSGMKRLENLRVEVAVSEEQTGNKLSYKFSLPILDLSGAVAVPPSNISSQGQLASPDE